MKGVLKKLCWRFEQVDESKEVFSNLVTLLEKLELDLQEDGFIEPLAVQRGRANENLMELEAQRKDEEMRGRSNWRTEEIHDAGNGQGIFATWGGTVSI